MIKAGNKGVMVREFALVVPFALPSSSRVEDKNQIIFTDLHPQNPKSVHDRTWSLSAMQTLIEGANDGRAVTWRRFSMSSICLAGQQDSCSTTAELSENSLQNLFSK